MMYSRKNSGYPRFTPPPNYNGVAFTRNYMPSSEIKETVKEAPETLPAESDTRLPTPEVAPHTESGDCPTTPEDGSPCEKCETHEKGKDEEGQCTQSLCSRLTGKELSLEDLLIIGAVILFVSGEFDGDLMLLLGILLIAGL